MPVARGREGVRQVMDEYKRGALHSGSPRGPRVKNRRQAIAIALHQAGLSRRSARRRRRAARR